MLYGRQQGGHTTNIIHGQIPTHVSDSIPAASGNPQTVEAQ